MLFRLSSPALMVVLLVIIVGSAIAGLFVGRSRREHHHGLKESSGVLQGAMLGFMGLVLAFGLSLALGRYDGRRTAVVLVAIGELLDDRHVHLFALGRIDALAAQEPAGEVVLALGVVDRAVGVAGLVVAGGLGDAGLAARARPGDHADRALS